MQIPKKFLPLIISLALGLVAIFLVNTFLRQTAEETRQRVLASQKNLITVVVARDDIKAGTLLAESMLREVTMSKDNVQPRAASSTDRVVGRVTMVPFSKGEQVLLNKITLSGMESSLSSKIPRGKRAITIPVDNIASVGGMIRPGDHVDIMGQVPLPAMTAEGKQVNQMTTMPLFQDVLVLAVGEEYTNMPVSGDKKERSLSPTVTLALAPQEANIISFVQEQARIRLILRSPEDTQVQQATPATWETVLRTVMPQAFQEQSAPKELPKPKKQVEIYHGLQRETRSLE